MTPDPKPLLTTLPGDIPAVCFHGRSGHYIAPLHDCSHCGGTGQVPWESDDFPPGTNACCCTCSRRREGAPSSPEPRACPCGAPISQRILALRPSAARCSACALKALARDAEDGPGAHDEAIERTLQESP